MDKRSTRLTGSAASSGLMVSPITGQRLFVMTPGRRAGCTPTGNRPPW